MTTLTPATRTVDLNPSLLPQPSAEPRTLVPVADTTPALPPAAPRTDNAPGATPPPPQQPTSHWYSRFSQVGGWSRTSWSAARDLWALGGPGYGSASVVTAIVGGAAALGADALGLVTLAPVWMTPPPPDPKGDLLGMVKERALHPPEGYNEMARAMRQSQDPRWSDTLSYPEMVDRVARDPKIVADITAALASQGVKLPQFAVQSLLNRPEIFMRIFAWGPQDLRGGFAQLNRAYQAGQIGGTTRDHQLPLAVDLNTFDLSTVKTNRVNPVRIAGPLHYGELPAVGSIDNERQNRLVSEIFDRLSANEHVADPAQRFQVRFGDTTYTSMRDFLGALRASGHQVEVRLRMQGADLPDLSLRNDDGSFTKLAVPTFTTIGLTGDDGRQALVPYVHVELEVQVTPPTTGTGPRVTGSAAWFQGINNIGFFPGSVERDSAWTNGRDFMTVRGDTAISTVLDASRYGDVIATAAALQNKRADGYGEWGNCGDSVLAVIYRALQNAESSSDVTMDPEFGRRIMAGPKRTFTFPQMIDPNGFRGELEQRIADTSRPEAERQTYRELLDTVSQLKDDAAPGALPNRDAARRALDVLDLVWPAGQEPFEAIGHAKAALRAYLDTP